MLHGLTQFKMSEGESPLSFTVVDSYTKERIEVRSQSLIVLKYSLMFNLACCYARMVSRLDLTSDPTSHELDASKSACQSYLG